MLTAHEVCAIIKVCAKNSVTELKLGDLSIRFGGERLEELQKVRSNDRVQEEIRWEMHQKDEVLAKEDQLAIMQIEDPVGYERFLMSSDADEPKVGEAVNEEDRGFE